MKKKIGIILVMIVIISATAGIAWVTATKKAERQSKEKKAATAQQYKASATTSQSITKTVIVDGMVEFNKKVKYFCNEDGKTVEKVNVKIGDNIKKGQKIIEYDDERLITLTNQLKEEEINLKSNKISIEKLKVTDNVKVMQLQNDILSVEQQIKESETTIENNENQISQLNSSIATVQDTLKMNRDLFAKGYSSRNEIRAQEDIISDYHNTIAKLNSDNENQKASISNKKKIMDVYKRQIELENAKEQNESVKYQIMELEQAIEKNKLKIAEIEKNIMGFQKYLTAEFNGVITDVYIEAGQNAAKGKDLVEIADNKDIIITANVSEFDINKIAVGDKGEITGDALDQPYTAVVSKIKPIANVDVDGNTVIPIEMRFLGLKQNIRNNYTVSIEITKSPNGKSLMVPLASIIRDDAGKSYVMVMKSQSTGSVEGGKQEIENSNREKRTNRQNKTSSGAVLPDVKNGYVPQLAGKAKKVEITTGEIKGNMVEVIGLGENDKVVEIDKTNTKKNKNNNPFTGGMGRQGGGPPGGF